MHRSSPLPGCSSPIAIRRRLSGCSPARARISSRRARGSSTSSVPSLSGSGPARYGCSVTWTRRSFSRSLSATQARRTLAVSGVARMQAFLVRERYSGGQHPTALMAKLRERATREGRRARSSPSAGSWRRARAGGPARLNAQVKQLEAEIRVQVRAHPDGRIFLLLFKSPNSVITAAELLAEIGDCRERYPDRDALAARRRPSRGRRGVLANGKHRPASAARATRGCVSRFLSARGLKPPWAPLGTELSMRRHSSAVTSTRARSGPSAVRGAESCGNAGATTPHTTLSNTAHYSATSQ